MTQLQPITASENSSLSLVNQITLQRERIHERLQNVPARSDKAAALRAQMQLLTNELLACEPAVKRVLS